MHVKWLLRLLLLKMSGGPVQMGKERSSGVVWAFLPEACLARRPLCGPARTRERSSPWHEKERCGLPFILLTWRTFSYPCVCIVIVKGQKNFPLRGFPRSIARCSYYYCFYMSLFVSSINTQYSSTRSMWCPKYQFYHITCTYLTSKDWWAHRSVS